MRKITPVLINSQIDIVDIETSEPLDFSNKNQNKQLPYINMKAHCIGFLHGNKITQFILMPNESETAYIEEVQKFITDEIGLDSNHQLTQFYSFNKDMESLGILHYFGIGIQVNELQPFKGKGWSKDKFFNQLYERTKAGEQILCTEFLDSMTRDDTPSLAIPLMFKEKKHNIVLDHNINCLLKELAIYDNTALLQKGHKVDSKGWLLE